jgi:hypothetical protein
MNPTEYKKIRHKTTFLFEYYVACGGYIKDLATFNHLMSMWFAFIRKHPKNATEEILKYLLWCFSSCKKYLYFRLTILWTKNCDRFCCEKPAQGAPILGKHLGD